jgi:YYY domain-containing protein
VADTLQWWLAAELMGAAALPYAFRYFRVLPDRGIAFARPLALLLSGYVLWLAAFTGWLPNRDGTAALVIASLAAGGVWLAARDWSGFVAELRARRWYILTVEVVFLVFFVGFAVLRAYEPDINGTEKPFESAFFQGVLRTETFGPRDPWYGGEPMSYYYFGYVLLAVITHVTQTAPEVAFNLGLALTGGMAAAGAFGLAYNLLAARGRVHRRTAILGALLAPLLLLVVSNFEGVFEMAAIHGVDSPRFYHAIAIENLTGPKVSTEWYPTEHWWWWRATRLGSGWNVEEFPFFSFLLGDLHAHVMVLPYSLLMLAGIFQLWRFDQPLDARFLRRHPWIVAGLALVAGGLYVTNAWDFPTALVVLGLITLARNYAGARSFSVRPLLDSAVVLAPVAVLAVLFYLPFYIGFTATPTELKVTQLLYTEVDRHAAATPPFQFFVFWGPMLFPALSYLVWRFVHLRPWRLDPSLVTLALAAGLMPLCIWAIAIASGHGLANLRAELDARGHLSITLLFLIPFVILAALVLLGEVFRGDGVPVSGANVFLAAAMLVAFLLILFPEFFFIIDIVVLSRHNTVFKFYYTAWLLLSVSGGVGVVELLSPRVRREALTPRPPLLMLGEGVTNSTEAVVLTPSPSIGRGGRGVRALPLGVRALWLTAALALLALALVYPVAGTMARTRGFTGEPTLDGLAGLRRSRSDLDKAEYAAAMWLRANVEGMPVVLEATGGDYSQGGRVAARTGLPTVVGWINHEWQERGALPPVEARVKDVATLYTTDDAALARRLIARYGVRYIYVGGFERERYGPNAGDTLARIARPVYQNPGVAIYAIEPAARESSPQAGTRP